ncbi:MAG TPA: Bug family tripartite tricarboxylate transporter substrate binding protein [Ottowia sp.]|nr:Bug family tripartite tricarboxylate transporter substrate binding protein [Ottowia sp.]
MPASRRHILQAAVATALAPALPARAQAGTAKIAVGFAAGGTVDAIGRRLADKLRGGYAETVIVDNRAGAGGRLALELTKRAPADGLSSVLTPSSMMVVYPHVYRNLSYDPQLDFLPVTTVCANALAFVVGPGVPDSVTSLKQFVAWAKGRSGTSYATPAAGSMLHFFGLVFSEQAGIDLTHVPYRGMAPAIQDLMAGNVASCLGTLGDYLPHLERGKLRPLAVTSAQRSRFMPGTPTFAEQGYDRVVGVDWFGLFLPAGTPSAVADKLRGEVRRALADPAVTETLDKLGFEPLTVEGAAFAARIQRELAFWAPIVKASGFTADS